MGLMANNTRRDTGNKANDTPVDSAASGGAEGTPSLPIVGDADPMPEGFVPIATIASSGRGSYATDLDDTGEFAQPFFGHALGGEETERSVEAEAGETAATPGRSPSEQERTSFWLQHLEAEVERLQGKFESLAGELRVREAKISRLRNQIEAKDAVVSDLRRQLDDRVSAQSALQAELDQANAQIADLIAAETVGEINLAQAEADLQEARQLAANTGVDRAELLAKIEGLSDAVDREAAAAAAAQKLYEEEAKRAGDLRARIEALETDIESGKKRWLAVSDELADYRNKLGMSEHRLAEAQAAAAAETQARVARDERIGELERLVSARDETLRSDAQKIAKLEGLLSQAAHQIDELADVIDTHEHTISRLEAASDARREAAAAIERSVRKLAEIDNGIIADLERFASTADEGAPGEAQAPDADAVAAPSRKIVDAVMIDKPPYPARKVDSPVAPSDPSQIQPRIRQPR